MGWVQACVDEGSEQAIAPPIGAPRGLEAFRLDAGGEEFVLMTWPSAAPSAADAPAELTAAEAAVAVLAAEGRSNRDIARARGSSPRTVANQLATVFRKLGVASRLELYARLGRAGAAKVAE